MKKKWSAMLLMVSILTLLPVISVQSEGKLTGYMDLSLILEEQVTWMGTPALVTWEGTIELEGVSTPFYMRFFLIGTGTPNPDETGAASHFGEIWEIWDRNPNKQPVKKAVLILAGTDEGLTNIESDLTWKYRMNGIVEYAASGWEEYFGRNVHMSGTIIWKDVPFAIGSTAPGIFRIN